MKRLRVLLAAALVVVLGFMVAPTAASADTYSTHTATAGGCHAVLDAGVTANNQSSGSPGIGWNAVRPGATGGCTYQTFINCAYNGVSYGYQYGPALWVWQTNSSSGASCTTTSVRAGYVNHFGVILNGTKIVYF